MARNVGISWVRKRDGFFTIWDDDDYYGPECLSELLKYSGRAEVIGKQECFVQTAAGPMRLFAGKQMTEVSGINGPLTSAWAADAVDFPEHMSICEDTKWVRTMRERGARVFATSRFHFMVRRFPPEHGHTWTVTDWQMAQSTLDPVYDVGPVDLDVVNGTKPEPERTLVPKRPRRPWDHPGWMRSKAHEQAN